MINLLIEIKLFFLERRLAKYKAFAGFYNAFKIGNFCYGCHKAVTKIKRNTIRKTEIECTNCHFKLTSGDLYDIAQGINDTEKAIANLQFKQMRLRLKSEE